MKYDIIKVRETLTKHLNREPQESEVINAQNDVNIICEILLQEIEDLKARVKKLELKWP